MCESCRGEAHGGRRTWTASHLVLVTLVLTLVSLSILGVVLSEREGAAATPCANVARETEAYETRFTRHLDAGAAVLTADTRRFLMRTARRGQSGCPELSAFARGLRPILQSVCGPCAELIRRSFPGPG